MKRLLISCALLGTSLFACELDTTSSDKPDLEATVVALADEAILPAAEAFDTSADELSVSIATLCQNPDEAAVEAARGQWRKTSEAWNRFNVYDFGPVTEGITPPDAFIDSFKAFRQGKSYVETLREELRTLVAQGTDVSGEDLSGWNFQRVGLVAIEVALFETATEPPDPAASAVAAELAAQPHKCTYLVKQAELLAQRAGELRVAWAPDGGDYRSTFISATNDALGGVLSGAGGHLEYFELRSIATQGYPISGQAHANIGASLDEVEAFLVAGGADSLSTRLDEARAPEVVTAIADRIAAARAAIAGENPEALGAELVGLDIILREDIPLALGIELGLNFTDGD